MIPTSIAKWYVPYFYPVRYKNIYGGRGSGKSHHAAINAIARVAHLFKDPDNVKKGLPYYPYRKTRILSGREFNTTIDTSVKVVLEAKISEMGLNDQFSIQNSQIVHRELGSKIIFKGLGRNIDNIRSAEEIDVWWFEEAQFLTRELMKIIIPTARHEYVCPITGILFQPEFWTVWNPKYRADWAWDRFVGQPRDGDLSTHVNYMHNPFLPKTTLEEALADKASNYEEYLHVWEGQPDDANADAQILPYQFVKACVDVWDQRPELSPRMRTEAGFDIALGGADNCALAIRTGPIVHDLQTWNGQPDLNYLAAEANSRLEKACERVGVKPNKINFDGNHPMVGAFRVNKEIAPAQGVLFGGAVLGKDAIWEKKIKNGDYFAKRNIQMGMALRMRAAQSYRLSKGENVDKWTCLFLNPNIKHIESVKGMLTQPIKREGMSGKLEIDKRGLEGDGDSPDEFDALCLAFHQDCEGGLRARSYA